MTILSEGVFIPTAAATEQARRAHELRKYVEVIALDGQGYDLAKLARLTGVPRRKIRNWLSNWRDLCKGGEG